MPISSDRLTSDIIGARVSYEDMRNPLRRGTVVAQDLDNFKVRWDTDKLHGEPDWWETEPESWSDLRQYGWNAG